MRRDGAAPAMNACNARRASYSSRLPPPTAFILLSMTTLYVQEAPAMQAKVRNPLAKPGHPGTLTSKKERIGCACPT
jgi:hypothetical protein